MPGPFRASVTNAALENHEVAVLLCRPSGPRSLHAGLVYRKQGGTVAIHLGWQDALSDSWPWPFVWAVPPEDPIRLRQVSARCRLIWQEFLKHRRMPYGLAWGGSRFTPRGELALAGGATGLTCATFVLGVFKSVGLDVVDEQDWPIRTDETLGFIERLAPFPPVEVAQRMADEARAGAKRITPDEVLGACTLPALPGRFPETSAAAAVALALLDAPDA